MIFNTIPVVLEQCDCCDSQNGAPLLGYPGYPARWVSLLTGHDPQPRISIFMRGLLPQGILPPG
jgi:hypothetical protein